MSNATRVRVFQPEYQRPPSRGRVSKSKTPADIAEVAERFLSGRARARYVELTGMGRQVEAQVSELHRLVDDGVVDEIVVLLPARTETRYWQRYAWLGLCFIRGRLRYPGHSSGAPFPDAVVYRGPRLRAFLHEFKVLGLTMAKVSGVGVEAGQSVRITTGQASVGQTDRTPGVYTPVSGVRLPSRLGNE